MRKIAMSGNSRCAEEFIKRISDDKNVKFLGQWIPENLPEIIDDFSEIKIPDFVFSADVVLDYTKHQDVPYLLKDAKKVITTSKCNLKNVICADCFCAINITEKFGIPEFKVRISKGKIKGIEVLKSSPCGAAFIIAEKFKDVTPEEALNKVGLLTQYECKGKGGPDSSIHKAAEIHKNALEDAIMKAKI
ncbi:MAG: hypothetical protein CVT88_02080 [Candidatus Altiarchaeales archaeon HGW-Altiarchaeales-1]|nr:MAG: hypothetical protein CVT88_02080 [Candidatus Altiarchaeales archaeon HGW-Altiarchaeales-1]